MYMAQKDIGTLVTEAVELLLQQFPSPTNNVFIREYKTSGKMQALKELLTEKLVTAAKEKGVVDLISRSGTLWSDLFYILRDIGIDYNHILLTKTITLDFAAKKLDVVDR